eukprot:s1274_g5.t1
MDQTGDVDLLERQRQLNQQILCYEKLSQLHQARAPVPTPSGPDLLNGEAPEKIERKGLDLLAKLQAAGPVSAQQLALASLCAQLKVCEETLSQEVATLEAKAKPDKDSKASLATPATPVECPMAPMAPSVGAEKVVKAMTQRELLKQMLRRDEVFKIRFLMRRDGFHKYDLKNLRSDRL